MFGKRHAFTSGQMSEVTIADSFGILLERNSRTDHETESFCLEDLAAAGMQTTTATIGCAMALLTNVVSAQKRGRK